MKARILFQVLNALLVMEMKNPCVPWTLLEMQDRRLVKAVIIAQLWGKSLKMVINVTLVLHMRSYCIVSFFGYRWKTWYYFQHHSNLNRKIELNNNQSISHCNYWKGSKIKWISCPWNIRGKFNRYLWIAFKNGCRFHRRRQFINFPKQKGKQFACGVFTWMQKARFYRRVRPCPAFGFGL